MSQSELSLKGAALKDLTLIQKKEWLVTNGIGGYASGTVSGILTRKYHGLLIAALRPPVERTLLVSKFDESIQYKNKKYLLSSNLWKDDTISPTGYELLEEFKLEGTTPVWSYRIGDALLQKRIWMKQGENTTYVSYYLAEASDVLELQVNSFVNYRSHHSITNSHWQMNFTEVQNGYQINANDEAAPFYLLSSDSSRKLINCWHQDFNFAREKERGYEHLENLMNVASFSRTLRPGEMLTLVATTNPDAKLNGVENYLERIESEIKVLDSSWTAAEGTPPWLKQLSLSLNNFVVNRPTPKFPQGKSIIAGYHWFSDWSRDTMISLPALTIDQPELTKQILLSYADFIDKGLLPTAFPDKAGETLQFNNADGTLWYFQAIKFYFDQTGDLEFIRDLFIKLVEIIDWHFEGTHHNIKVDPADGLLYAGEEGYQLTWMDAKYRNKVFTPRIGKPVEINALWYNALLSMSHWAGSLGISSQKEYYSEAVQKVRTHFQRFWNPNLKCLFDVIDTPSGWPDPSIRPNQILAISLPFSPITQIQQEGILKICESHLLTPYGLRSLSPKDPEYVGSYLAETAELRDAAYHQGTVWLWLLPHFALAHFRLFRDKAKALSFFDALPQLLTQYGIGSLGEIFDGNTPFAPQGCISQAWSVAEVMRAYKFLSEQADLPVV